MRGLLQSQGRTGGIPRRWASLADINVLLAGGMQKIGNYPVLARGSSGQWDDWGVRELRPLKDESGNTVYKSDGIWGYYWGRPDSGTANFQIGLAKSTTEGVTWARYGSNPIISPAGSGSSWYARSVAQPSVVQKADGTYVMIAQGWTTGSSTSLGVLTSNDGLSWSDQGVKIQLGALSESGSAFSQMGVPSLIRRASGAWVVMFEGLRSSAPTAWRIFGATATDPAGAWTMMNDGAPVLTPSTHPAWDSYNVANAQVIEAEPGAFLIAYNGTASTNTSAWSVGFASTTDFSTFTRNAGNPFLGPGPSSSFDDVGVEACYLFREPHLGRIRLLYHGFRIDNTVHEIGLAHTP